MTKGQYKITFVGQNGNYQTTLDLVLIIQDGSYWLDSPNPTRLAVRTGGSGTVSVGTGFGFAGQTPTYKLNLSVSGLPSGTTATFPASIVPGDSVTITVNAAANAPVSHNNSVLISATPTDGGFIYTTNFLLDVAPPAGQLATSRSDIVPTEGDIVSAVYDSAHQVVFASNPTRNSVDIISPTTKSILGSVRIPSPKKLALSLDGTKVIVGTNTAQAYWIDTTSRRVIDVKRFPVGGAAVPEVHELSTGEYFLTGYLSFSWTAQVCASDASSCAKVEPGSFSPSIFFVSANGTKVLMASGGSPGYSAVYDAASRTLQETPQLLPIAIDPTGTYFLFMTGGNGSGVSLYDIQSGQQRNLIPDGIIFGAAQGTFSPDGRTVYLVADSQYTNGSYSTYTIDVAGAAVTGVAPTLATWLQGNYEAETPYTSDSSGLIFGGISHGLAIDDTTFYNNVPLGSSYIPWLTVLSGPLNATAQTSFGGAAFDFLPDVYFGGRLAQSSLASGTLTSTVPASSTPGPVNIKMEFSNGTEGFKAWGFTYGPWIQVADGSGADASGGASASIVGMGMGTDPSKVQVSVGGTSAQVTGIAQLTSSSGLSPIYPYPSSIVTYLVPPGVPGPADIVVTTPDGNNTLKSGMRYSQIEDYSSTDTFTAVLYDRTRNRLYLTAGDHIDVFNVATSTFGSPITPPNLNGKSGFVGMTLTPDASKLLIANQTDGSLAVVNPDSPASATAVLVASPQITPSCTLGPWKVAATSDHRAIIALSATPSGCAGGGMYALNLISGISTPFYSGNSCGNGEAFASRDGSKIVISPPQGAPCLYDVATNSSVSFGSAYATTTAIAGDGTLALSTSYSNSWDIADSSGSVVGHSSLLDVLAAGIGLSSAAMNDSGSLMYLANAVSNTSAGTNSAFIDIIDVNHSDVRSRIRLSENIQSVVTPMAIDASDARVFLITNRGLTVITVSGVPLSVASVAPSSSAAGTEISVRGSGFQSGMTATVNGVSALVVVVDSQTAKVTIPAVSSGVAKLTLTNPDGQTYSLEAAFRVN
jgi:hypothetical protein